ncbi:hypothetical protein Tco_1307060, partial [Tanacetum coccineum]
MSNSNTNLQTQSSNALHNAIMEAGSKDRPPMLAPGNYVQWKSRIKYCLQNLPYTYQWAEKTVLVAEGSSETTTERFVTLVKQSQELKTVSYHKLYDILKQHDDEVKLNAEQADWKDDTDDESDEQELEAHDVYMAQIQEVTPDVTDISGPIFDMLSHCIREQDDTDEIDQEHDLLASLIKKLKCEIDDSKNRN